MGTAPETFDVTLTSARTLAPAVRELVFERVDGRPMDFRAGQWVNLVLPLAGGEQKRAYSIASAPAATPRFELAVTRVASGPGSAYLHELPLGATLRAIGPQGFFVREGDEASVFVGTGTGLTPLRSMLRDALARGSRTPLALLLGFRHEEDILYKDELEAVARDHEHVALAITLSQPRPDWSGRRGYVQAHLPEVGAELARRAGPGAPMLHVYVCGLERMVKAVREVARGPLGLDRRHVHGERYD